jgi:hypothetical protein
MGCEVERCCGTTRAGTAEVVLEDGWTDNDDVDEVDGMDGDVDMERDGTLSLAEAADREGPRRRAAMALLSGIKRLNSYLSGDEVRARSQQSVVLDAPRMKTSNSLSRSDSIMLVGGGCFRSSGLYRELTRMFPYSFMN